jgi:hypothetical protein
VVDCCRTHVVAGNTSIPSYGSGIDWNCSDCARRCMPAGVSIKDQSEKPMRVSPTPVAHLHQPSVADTKQALVAWGDDAHRRTAKIRSQVSSGAIQLAVGAGIALCLAVVVRRLLPSRSNRSSMPMQSSTTNADASLPLKSGRQQGHQLFRHSLGWLAISRISHWILPHAIGAARATLLSTAKPQTLTRHEPSREKNDVSHVL